MQKTLLTAVLLASSASVVAQAATHCEADEITVFSCAIAKSKKIVSVCASAQQSESAGYLQYRFGAPQKIELQYPKDRLHPLGNFEVFYATPVLDDGSRAMVAGLGFAQGAFGYELSTLAKSDSSETTLEVTRDGKTIASLRCVPQSVVNADFSYMSVLSAFGLQ